MPIPVIIESRGIVTTLISVVKDMPRVATLLAFGQYIVANMEIIFPAGVAIKIRLVAKRSTSSINCFNKSMIAKGIKNILNSEKITSLKSENKSKIFKLDIDAPMRIIAKGPVTEPIISMG